MPSQYGGLMNAFTADTGRRPSDSVWSGAPILEILAGQRDGVVHIDDFTDFYADVNRYDILVADAGTSIGGLNSVRGGVLRLITGATDNNEVYIGGGIGTAAFTDIDADVADVWFEGRFRLSAVADHGVFFGLGALGIVAANMLADNTGALVDDEYVGFRILSADSDGLDAVYNTASGGGESVHQEADTGISSQVLTANTWVKVGLRYIDQYRKTYYYVNGLLVNTSGVAESATNFPDGVQLHWAAGIKTGAASSVNMDIDWVRIAASFK